MTGDPAFAGIDVGTSGVRAVATDGAGVELQAAARPLPPSERGAGGAITQEPFAWEAAVLEVLSELAARLPGRIAAIAVDGTSGTLLLTDAGGTPLAPARMYNDAGAGHLAEGIAGVAPPESGAHGPTSPLARLLVEQERHPTARHALHQADWIAFRLGGPLGVSDENNALKLGYDPITRRWPGWLDQLGVRCDLLPEVRVPGTPIGRVAPELADRLGLDPDCLLVAGTTDGCASFLATGVREIGDAVTALGSTLTVKLLSDRPLFSPAHGVYSHRLGEQWLAGGASNSGGAAVLRYFEPARIEALTPELRPERSTGFGWHPLPATGERFPVADPTMTFEPERPVDDARFLQGLLEGVAEVEARAYRLLAELGGPPLRAVRTTGGGSANPAWTVIRARVLGVPLQAPASVEAAAGTARLARDGYRARHGRC